MLKGGASNEFEKLLTYKYITIIFVFFSYQFTHFFEFLFPLISRLNHMARFAESNQSSIMRRPTDPEPANS